ncbi:hypothetical protein GQ600_3093 [Phytophthora cactorum]|nr:hypothetical protein GQ600_3093 [Phytophthora cactorum]
MLRSTAMGSRQRLVPIRSVSKLDFLTRTPDHPLYRTTSGYDYGRYVDFKDVALSCPKHVRPAGFTKEFIAGNYADNSLLSLDNSKRRAEKWQQKMEVRTSQMRVKYPSCSKCWRRRRSCVASRGKATARDGDPPLGCGQLQARMRGYLTRCSLAQENCIGIRRRRCASSKRVEHGTSTGCQTDMEAKRRDRQELFAVKIQRICRNFILLRHATRHTAEAARGEATESHRVGA